MIDIIVTVLVGLAMLVGMLGVFVPGIPDMILIWLAALAYGLIVEWGRWGPWAFGLITVLAIGGSLAEVWASGVGAKVGGGSLWSVMGGLVLGLLGLIFLSPVGCFVGLLVGTFVLELVRQRKVREAMSATLGLSVGYGLSFAIKLGFGLSMIGAWIFWVVTKRPS